LRQQADQLGLTPIVSFEGYQAHDDVWPYFAGCDLFVLPSWDEAFGVVYIEALGLGKAAIGCEGEGGPEDLRSLAHCMELVRPRDVTSLVQAIKQLLDDPARRQHMGQAGRQVVTDHFTWERNAADTWQLYQRLTGRETA
jgi:teichuronic acid biosynthesis glycosyltransferase TuaC